MYKRILTETGARNWFKNYGWGDQAFDEIFGDIDLSKKTRTAIVKVVNDTIFIKLKFIVVGYLILPQSDMMSIWHSPEFK